jgi:hypothetical protein
MRFSEFGESFRQTEDPDDVLLDYFEWTQPHTPAFGFNFGAESAYGGFSQGAVGSTAIAATALRQVAKEQNYALSDDVLRMLLGHAAFESGYGRGDPAKNTLANTNNWGSVQVTAPWVKDNLGKAGFGAVAHQDSDPKKGPFVGWYRVYPNAIEGARGFFNTVKPAITSDIDQYAANLYHRSYYGGVHANDPAANIKDYASAIRHAMPGSAPADTSASIAEAQRFNVGPLAPAPNRMTAKNHVDGRVKWPATVQDAQAAWTSSWSSPGAYGLNLLGKVIDFASVIASDGVVWLGPTPPGFGGGGVTGAIGGALALQNAALQKAAAPLGGAIAGLLLGSLAGVPGALVGAVMGAGAGYMIGQVAASQAALAAVRPQVGGQPPPQVQSPVVAQGPSSLGPTAPLPGPTAAPGVVKALAATAAGSLWTLGWQAPATVAAVTAWQRARGGITADGKYGPASQKAMAADLAPTGVPAAYAKGGGQ